MKILPVIIESCKECSYARFTKLDLRCRLMPIPCGFYKSKSLKLFKDFPDWCPLENIKMKKSELG